MEEKNIARKYIKTIKKILNRGGTKMRLKFFLFFLLFFSQTDFSFGAVKVSEGFYEGCRSITMENEYLRVTVLPEDSGRIAEYVYKSEGNNYFLPYRAIRNPLLELAGIAASNFGGWEDWFLEAGTGGVQKDRLLYESKVYKEPGAVSIVLKRPAGGTKAIKFERMLTLKENSSSLKVQIRLINQGNQESTYWMHAMVQIGGDFNHDDYEFLPLRKSPEAILLPGPSCLKTRVVTESHLLIKRVKERAEDTPMYLPCQPWRALLDKEKKIIVAQVISPASLCQERTIFYTWCGKGGADLTWVVREPPMSQEIIFPSVAPGEERTFTIYLIAFPDLAGISYANPEVGIWLKGISEIKEKGYFELEIVAANKIEKASLVLKNKEWEFKIPVYNVMPGEKLVKKVTLPVDLLKNQSDLSISGKWLSPFYEEDFEFLKERRED